MSVPVANVPAVRSTAKDHARAAELAVEIAAAERKYARAAARAETARLERLTVFRKADESGAMSRAEIARAAGVTRSRLSAILDAKD